MRREFCFEFFLFVVEAWDSRRLEMNTISGKRETVAHFAKRSNVTLNLFGGLLS
jgi:hypothetical protein